MNLASLLHIDHISVNLDASDKEALISHMVGMISNHPSVIDAKEVEEAVLAREKMMSTGVGKGLALPHAKTVAVKGMIAALVTTANPVDFGSLDNEPVRIAFLLVGKPDAKSMHVRILSRVSRIMNQDEVRKQVLNASSPEVLFSILSEYDDPNSGS